MRVGIHLPQYGRAASPAAIRDAAVQAESLGYADVWVSDHIAVPDEAPYPPPFIFDPLVTLTWAGACTSSVGLGTSVLVLPYRHPVALAKELASLDLLSGGRLTVGAAAGWLEAEFDALDVPFADRGQRTDDAIELMRACWQDRVVGHTSKTFEVHGMRVEPRPGRRIPILVGGTSRSARNRAATLGDGWHAIGLAPEALAPMITAIRSDRPDPSFVVSVRVTWDGLDDDLDDIAKRATAYADIGVDHLVVAPSQSQSDRWRRSVARLASVLVT